MSGPSSGLVEPHLGGHVLQVDPAGLGVVGLGGPPYEEEPVDAEESLPESETRGRIFSHVRPSCERAVSDLDRSMHISLWV